MSKITIYHQLDDLYKELITMEEEDIEEVVEELKSINFQSLLEYYVEISGNKKFDDMDLMTCRKLVEILQFIYNNTAINPPVSDNDYDKLYQVIIDNGIGDIVGAVNTQNKPVREHQYPLLRGSLNKVHFMYNMDKEGDKRRSVEDWIYTIESILGYPITGTDEFKVCLQPKWDGVSVVFENDKDGFIEHALLRGDTDKNLAVEITALFKDWLEFTKYADGKRKFGIKTEVLMTREMYDRICKEHKDFRSPRSATSSIVNETELQPELGKYLCVKPLRIQYEDSKPEMIFNEEYDVISNLYNMKEIEYKIDKINEEVRESGLSTDGVVLVLLNPAIQARLGRDGAINRFEVAYKFPAEEQKTTLLNVEFPIGLGGNITPVAKVKPVVMRGNTIESISLGSIDRFRSLDLNQGDEVIIKYEIIPYLDIDSSCKKNEKGYKFTVPTHCKYCGCRLEEDPTLKCVNMECSSRIIGAVVNYINKMRIEGVGIGIISTFFDNGIITGIESLYKLPDHKSKILELPGFGIKSYENIIKGIQAKQEVYDYELLGSLGIPDIGEKTFKKVLSVMDLYTLLNLSKEYMLIGNLVGLPGFGEKTATKIQKGLNSRLKTIYFLLDTLTLRDKKKSDKGKICFTKVRDERFETELINKGYEVSDSLTKTTNYLIVPSLDISSTKVDKAKKYGIEILTLDQAIRIL